MGSEVSTSSNSSEVASTPAAASSARANANNAGPQKAPAAVNARENCGIRLASAHSTSSVSSGSSAASGASGSRKKRALGKAGSEPLDVVVEEKSSSDLNSFDSSSMSATKLPTHSESDAKEEARDDEVLLAQAPTTTANALKYCPDGHLLEPSHQEGESAESACSEHENLNQQHHEDDLDRQSNHTDHGVPEDEDEYGGVYKSTTVRLGESVSISDEISETERDTEQKAYQARSLSDSPPAGLIDRDASHSKPMQMPPLSSPAEAEVEKPPMPLTWEDGARDEAARKNAKRQTIGDKYEIISLIGRGAQGTVTKCRHIETQQYVAIKTIKGGSLVVGTTAMPRQVGRRRRKGGSGMNSVMKQVSREIALLKKVNHPNIVRLLEVVDVTTDRDIHLVFEYVSGGPLRQLSDQLLLKNSGVPLPEDEARAYFRQLCMAVRYLHHHGIMHRDIKPSNLIIDRVKRQLKLTDLGIAAQTRQGKEHRILGTDDDLVATTLVVGTPAFLPPEFYRIKANEEAFQERLMRDLDSEQDAAATQETAIGLTRESSILAPRPEQFIPGRAADIWAMGVTLYSFIYGGLPFTQRRRQSRGSFSQQMRKFPTFSSTGSSSSVDGGAYSSGERDDVRGGSSEHRSGGGGGGGGSSSSEDRSGSPLDLVVSPLRRKRSSRAPLTQDEMQQRILENPLRFPGTGLGTSMRLRMLLQRMLDKDPRTRATIDEICNHEWVCKYESFPALSEEQLTSIEISQKDQDHAITNYSSMLVRMQRAFRGMRSRAHIFGSGIRSSEHSFSQHLDNGASGPTVSSEDLDDFLRP